MADEEEGGGGGWLISYADLMTLLFAAFVVLYGITPQGKTVSINGVASSIREAFVEIPDEIKGEEKVGPIKAGHFTFKAYQGETERTPDLKKAKIKQSQKVNWEPDKNRVDRLLDEMASSKNGMDFGLRSAMSAEPDERGFRIKLMGAYFYEPKSYRLNRRGRDRLIQLGKLLKRIDQRFLIEGHTDGHPASGPFSNDELGALRASYAARLLVKHARLSANRIETISHGDRRPIASNDHADGRKKNRRIEIKILYLKDY